MKSLWDLWQEFLHEFLLPYLVASISTIVVMGNELAALKQQRRSNVILTIFSDSYVQTFTGICCTKEIHWLMISLTYLFSVFDNRQSEDHGVDAIYYKSQKRKALQDLGYVIVGNIGDQWSDITGYSVGSRVFKLPNPMYYISWYHHNWWIVIIDDLSPSLSPSHVMLIAIHE